MSGLEFRFRRLLCLLPLVLLKTHVHDLLARLRVLPLRNILLASSSGLALFRPLLGHVIHGSFQRAVFGLLLVVELVDFLQDLCLIEHVTLEIFWIGVGVSDGLDGRLGSDSLVLAPFQVR